MKAAYLALVRTNYWLVVILTTGFSAYIVLQFVGSLVDPATVALVLTAALFLVLGGGAMVRRIRGRPAIPDPFSPAEWTLTFLMTCLGSLAHCLSWAIGFAMYQYSYVYPDREREGGPMAFLLMIAAFCYFLVLLMGEFGIRHDRGDQPRINPSNGRTEALSANTVESSAAEDTPR